MEEIPLANWNGEEMPLDQVRVSVMDRAFFFGDAIYEAMRVYGGRIWLLEDHMERFARSLASVRIACDLDRLERRMKETVAHSGACDALIYVQVTRGEAPRAHAFPQPAPTPNELIFVKDLGGDPFADVRPKGVSCITLPDERWGRCDIKSTNLLANCLACEEARQAGCYEALLIRPEGMISEATHNSVFAVKDDCLLTAPMSPLILPGVTRKFVMRLVDAANVPCAEKTVRVADLATIDELFLTGTTSEILPIVQVDGKAIGAGVPGPVTKKLQEVFMLAVAAWLQRTAE